MASYSFYKGLADLGSILGVFFGISVISVVEFFYCIFIKYFFKNLCIQESNDQERSEFAFESTIHSVKFIFNRSLHRGVRLFWAFILFFAVIGCIYNARQNYRKLAIEPEVEITQQQKPIENITFPAVTICTPIFVRANLTIMRLNSYLHHQRLHPEAINLFSPETWNHFFANLYWMIPEAFILLKNYNELTLNVTNPWHYRSNVNFVPYLNRSHYEIDEMFLECKLRGIPVKCSEILKRVMTSRGICYTYNMEGFHTVFKKDISKHFDSYGRYDKVQESQWTLDNGYKAESTVHPLRAFNNEVSFLLDIKFEDVSHITNDGVFYNYFLHLPNEIISHIMKPNFFRMESETLLTLSAKSKRSSERLRDFLPENRGCYFQDERKLQHFMTYTKSNCEVDCFVNFTLSNYGCTSFLLPHNDSATLCDSAWDLHMMYEMETSFPTDIKVLCGCLPNCNNIIYSKKSEVTSIMQQEKNENTLAR